MRYSGKTLMSLCTMMIASWAVITALKWPLRTAIFPVIIGIPVFFMAMGEFLFSLYEREEIANKKSGEGVKPSEKKEVLPVSQSLLAFALIIGFFLLILFFGFPIGIPLFVFLYLKFYGRERWGISVGLAATAWACFFGLFIWLLNIPFPEGWVQKGLRALGIG